MTKNATKTMEAKKTTEATMTNYATMTNRATVTTKATVTVFERLLDEAKEISSGISSANFLFAEIH